MMMMSKVIEFFCAKLSTTTGKLGIVKLAVKLFHSIWALLSKAREETFNIKCAPTYHAKEKFLSIQREEIKEKYKRISS